MLLHERIKQVREYRGLKQLAVANEMNVTQQAYSWLETKSSNIKLDTLQRFCAVMGIELPFLMATEIPITDENMKAFDEKNCSQIFEEYKRLKNKDRGQSARVLRKVG